MPILLNVLAIFKLVLNISRHYFTIETLIDMRYKSSRRKHNKGVLSNSKERICATVISHININESDNLNTPNSDNVIGN